MLSNMGLSTNTPPTSPWEEALQLTSNGVQIGLTSPRLNKTGSTRSGIFFLTASSASSTPHVPSHHHPISTHLPSHPPQFLKTDFHPINSRYPASPKALFSMIFPLSLYLSYQSVSQVLLAAPLGDSSSFPFPFFASFFYSRMVCLSSLQVSCNHKCIPVHGCIIQYFPSLRSL